MFVCVLSNQVESFGLDSKFKRPFGCWWWWSLSRLRLLRPHGLPGSSVHGILQAIILRWVAISFSI